MGSDNGRPSTTSKVDKVSGSPEQTAVDRVPDLTNEDRQDCYFAVMSCRDDQLTKYAERNGISEDEIRKAADEHPHDRWRRQLDVQWARVGAPARHCRHLPHYFKSPAEWVAERNRIGLRITQQRDGIFALLGPCGSGKTQAAVEIMHRALYTHGMSCKYVKWRDLIEHLHREAARMRLYDWNGTGETEDFTGYDMLTIDNEDRDRGREKDEESDRLVMAHLIDKRYDACKVTVFVANVMPEGFKEMIGHEVADRMAESGEIVVMDWPSLRENPAATAKSYRFGEGN